MRVVGDMTEDITITLNEALELQRLERACRNKELTREQFIAAVEEISLKMEKRLSGSLSDIKDGDIPY